MRTVLEPLRLPHPTLTLELWRRGCSWMKSKLAFFDKRTPDLTNVLEEPNTSRGSLYGMAAIAFLILLALLATPALACSCASSPVQYCERLPDPNNSQQAVFVGMVREFYPRSRDQ